jgi:hypothetical protein
VPALFAMPLSLVQPRLLYSPMSPTSLMLQKITFVLRISNYSYYTIFPPQNQQLLLKRVNEVGEKIKINPKKMGKI